MEVHHGTTIPNVFFTDEDRPYYSPEPDCPQLPSPVVYRPAYRSPGRKDDQLLCLKGKGGVGLIESFLTTLHCRQERDAFRLPGAVEAFKRAADAITPMAQSLGILAFFDPVFNIPAPVVYFDNFTRCKL